MSFLENEAGAVTVDWVVLTGALVGLGLAVMAVVSGGVEDLSTDIETNLSDTLIKTSFETGPTISNVTLNVGSTFVGANSCSLLHTPDGYDCGSIMNFTRDEVQLDDGTTVYRITGASYTSTTITEENRVGDDFVLWSTHALGQMQANGELIEEPANVGDFF